MGTALATTGYDDGYLRNLAYVAKNVGLSHRCDNLSWTHHREVATLEPEQRAAFIQNWYERWGLPRYIKTKDLQPPYENGKADANERAA